MPSYIDLQPGDPAPYFQQRCAGGFPYTFDVAGGRYVVLCFFGSAADPHSRAAIDAVKARTDFFQDVTASFFGVSIDPQDELERRVAESVPGYQFLWDFDLSVCRLYGVAAREAGPQTATADLRRRWMVLDPTLRIMKVIPFTRERSDIDELLSYCRALPPPERFAGVELQAPVLVLPNVFEPELCRKLVDLYRADGGTDSGIMREKDGKTIGVYDYRFKRRRDYVIEDREVIGRIQTLFRRRVVPEIAKIHQFSVTRMERYIVACYSGQDGGHFRPHRDNTTKGTAHRRFAVSVNLNDDFEGGAVSFPEYGPRGFKMPAGCALVFSCSLLHTVSKVTAGQRYAFLPFLYDDAAASLRQENRRFLSDGPAERVGETEVEDNGDREPKAPQVPA